MIEKIITPKKVKVPDKLKALVLDSVKRHAWNIGVSHYVGDILWMEEDKKHDDTYTHAEMDVDRRYLRATLKLFPIFIELWKTDGNQYVENTIAHEVAHCATAHLYHVATARYCDDGEMQDAWETLTETLSRVSVKLDAERRPTKKV